MSLSSNISVLSSSDDQSNQFQNDVFQLAEYHGLDELHLKSDPKTGLRAIIAIHSTTLGPALGGTRSRMYESTQQAIADVVRLARGMSYKAAFAGLPYGGGKAVLIQPETIADRDAYFQSYGKFIDSLGGRFITAVDVGTSVEDMDLISMQSAHVLSTSAGHGDPSFYTALGVFKGICAAVKVKFNRNNLNGIKVSIQGVGKVGFHLASLLYKQGAKLRVSDIDPKTLERCTSKFNAIPVSENEILSLESDIFSPCALGGVLDKSTVNKVNTQVICGAANNQLGDDGLGDTLHHRGIFYVPDYVANSGGLMHVILGDNDELQRRIENIYAAVIDIFERSETSDEPAHRVANTIAEEILYS